MAWFGLSGPNDREKTIAKVTVIGVTRRLVSFEPSVFCCDTGHLHGFNTNVESKQKC